MLLDKYVLTQGFSNLLSLSPAASSHGPSTSFVKRVNQSMTRLDPLLKTLQVRPVPAEGLVQAYLIHIGDKSETNFKKVLELKGVRKQDQAHLVELFQVHRDSPRTSSGELVQSSPLLTPLVIGSGESKGIAALGPAIASGVYPPGLSARNASAFGEKLFSAARDGVERIGSGTGTPTGGVGSAPAREGSMERAPDGETKTSMNENLKNIGKFFRRDISGFGGRFGAKREGSVDDTVR
jgi:vacuolar protein sorting-associated protein 53